MFYFPHPGQQCTTSCTNTSHSEQKSFLQSGQRYRPNGLSPSTVLGPTLAVADAVPLAALVASSLVVEPEPDPDSRARPEFALTLALVPERGAAMASVFVLLEVVEVIGEKGAAQPWQAGEADAPLVSGSILYICSRRKK